MKSLPMKKTDKVAFAKWLAEERYKADIQKEVKALEKLMLPLYRVFVSEEQEKAMRKMPKHMFEYVEKAYLYRRWSMKPLSLPIDPDHHREFPMPFRLHEDLGHHAKMAAGPDTMLPVLRGPQLKAFKKAEEKVSAGLTTVRNLQDSERKFERQVLSELEQFRTTKALEKALPETYATYVKHFNLDEEKQLPALTESATEEHLKKLKAQEGKGES